METVPAATQDDSSSANPSSIKSDDSSPRQESGCGSPPPNCAICLGTCRNKSFTDSCLHQFCFKCLLTWSKVKAECPLCKQNFRSIIHNVRSNHQYEEYMVVHSQAEENSERIEIDSLATATRRFRYRTTLTVPRRQSFAFHQFLMRHPRVRAVYPPGRAYTSVPVPQRRMPTYVPRRSVYRYDMWARPLPDFTGRFRDCTPEFYRYNDSQMHRLVPWLNRELHYLLNENVGHISFVMTIILDLLRRHHINSSEFREAMQRYFGERTEHFLHELYCFASTPYDMAGYDRNVQYTTYSTISTLVNEVISSTDSEASVDSDIVMISSSEPTEIPAGPSRVPAPVYPQSYIPEPSTAHNNVVPVQTISHSDTDDDSSEVMVVGYIKPPQDRTPEVVDLLGSDSDVIVQDTIPEQPTATESQEERPPLLLKLKLTNPTNQPPAHDSGSDDGSYTPPPLNLKNWRRHNGHATDSSYSTDSYSPSSDSYSSYSSSSSEFSTRDSEQNVKRKRRRKTNTAEKHKRKSKRPSRAHHKSKKVKKTSSREKQGKRKSNSGKGVKSSKALCEPSTSRAAEEQRQAVVDEPSTSGLAKKNKLKRDKSKNRRHSSRESKRLKSVVNVINSSRKSEESSPNSHSSTLNESVRHNQNENELRIPQTTTDNTTLKVESEANITKLENAEDNSDSDDDLPLNLTIAKSLLSLSRM